MTQGGPSFLDRARSRAGARVRGGRGAALLALMFGAVVVLGMPSADAAPDPTPATLTQLAYDGTTVQGVLTLQGVAAGVKVDPSSLVIDVAGRSTPAVVQLDAVLRRAVVLVLDTSGSMNQGTPPGITVLKQAVNGFLDRVPADVEVGIVAFSNAAYVAEPLTRDHEVLRASAQKLGADGETALYDAIILATKEFGAEGDRSLVVLSDGVDTMSAAKLPAAIDAVQKSGARVDTIGLRTKKTADSILQEIAITGNGSFAPANNDVVVRAAFDSAARALDSQVTWTAQLGSLPLGAQPIQVRGVANGAPFVATGTVNVTQAPAPLPTLTPSATLPVIAAAPPANVQTSTLILGVTGIFVGLLALSAGFLAPAFRSSRRQRIETIEAYTSRIPHVTVNRAEATSAITASLVDVGERVMAGRESTSRTLALLQRADLPWRPGEWAVLRFVSVIVGVALGMLFFHDGIVALLGILLGGLLGILGPGIGLRYLAKRRAIKFERQMPDILMLVASSLSTGFSLPQALDAVSKDVAEPAAKEFARVMAETRIGADIEDALERMSVRMNSENMRWAAMAIGIQRQVGGNLADTLRTTAATLREREFLRRHVRALSAEGRLSAYILVALPILMFLYEVTVNREYISLLWTHPLGWAMVGASLVSMGIGIFWMRKAIQVEV